MTIYHISEELERLANEMLFDEDTGELVDGAEAIIARIDELQMERSQKMENIAKLILNLRAESEALKNEVDRLKKRRERLDKKAMRLLDVLNRECAGQKTDLGVATVSYTKSDSICVYDSRTALEWLMKNHDECLRYKEPEVSKSDVKKLIKSGTEVPGIIIENKQNCSLK